MILLRSFGRRLLKGKIYVFTLPILLLIILGYPFASHAYTHPQNQKLLKEIHDEVLNFGTNDDPNLITRDFWMDLDGQENNKEEHVIVMRHNDGMRFRMTLQVTYYTEDKGKRFIRYAKDTKLVQCCIKEDDLQIDKSDYSEEEMEGLLTEILKGIRHKKEILKLIKQ